MERQLDSCMYMAQEEVDLALGLSLGSGTGNHHLLQPIEASPLEPSLTLSLPIAVKRGGGGGGEREGHDLLLCGIVRGG
jgi:hypothetical protein